ncbi:hypothetical protein N9Z54_02985 [Planctomycetota bacterium]|nr:hypothetical protein [Planctomycetota bacterium]
MVGLPLGSTALVADLEVHALPVLDGEGSTLVDELFTGSLGARAAASCARAASRRRRAG